jgi:hypothetical protein
LIYFGFGVGDFADGFLHSGDATLTAEVNFADFGSALSRAGAKGKSERGNNRDGKSFHG